MENETVTYDGKIYQIGKRYMATNINAKGGKDSDSWIVRLGKNKHTKSKLRPCLTLIKLQKVDDIGEIEDAPIELEDGCWYLCEGGQHGLIHKTALHRKGDKLLDNELGGADLSMYYKVLHKLVKG